MPTHLFVYGTLQPGRLRWPFLAPFAVGHRPATAPGTLYDSGNGWPVAVFDAPRTDPIPGTLVELDGNRIGEALDVLDRVESTATDLLRRITVVTVDGVEAWAYDWPHSTVGFVPIDRWAGADEH